MTSMSIHDVVEMSIEKRQLGSDAKQWGYTTRISVKTKHDGFVEIVLFHDDEIRSDAPDSY